MGAYAYFRDYSVVVDTAFVCPDTAGVKFTDTLTVFLNGNGKINHIIND
jgi:hypothetical protein